MTKIEFTNLFIVTVVAFLAPLLLGFVPKLRMPAIVLEIVAGIILGPAVLNWVHVDEPVAIMALIGLVFLLFLSGLEVDFGQLRGRRLKLAGMAFGLSLVIAVAAGFTVKAIGLTTTPLFVAIVLVATAIGVVIPVLKDSGQITTGFGQLVVAGASIAEFGAIVLLSLLFSEQSTDVMTKVLLLGGFAILVLLVGVSIWRAERWSLLSGTLKMLQDTTAQIRIRGAFMLLIGIAVLADFFGFELILGAFAAGAILSVVDRDSMHTHKLFHAKLDAIGFGVFIPIFFITSGLRFDLSALVSSTAALVQIPIFLIALLVVRGLPAFLYRPLVGTQRSIIAGLLQATSLPFIVAATQIGLGLHVLSQSTAAALVAAGLLSVIIFPAVALTLLKRAGAEPETCAMLVDQPM